MATSPKQLLHWLRTDTIALALFGGVLAALVWQHWATPPFSPDSWSYFELSKTVFNDFFRFNTWRSYQFTPPYSSSFPPLWPVLIALWNQLFDSSINAGLYLNLLIVSSTALVLGGITQRWCQSRAPGYLVAIALLSHAAYVDELMAARSIPLTTLLWALIISVFLRANRLHHILLMALLASLAILTRFDFLLAAIMLGGLAAWQQRPRFGLALGVYGTVCILMLLPWIIYSWHHFGVLWVSDNSRTVLTASRTFVLDYFLQPPELGWAQPGMWLVKQWHNVLGVGYACFSSLLRAWPLWAGLLLGTVLCWQQRVLPRQDRHYLLLLLLPVMVIGSVMLTGYTDQRYFTPLWLWLYLGLFATLSGLSAPKTPWLIVILTAAVSASTILSQVVWPTRSTHNSRHLGHYAALENCMQHEAKRQQQTPHLLFLNTAISPFRFGALTGLPTFIKPSNLTPTTAAAFVEQYQITHVVVGAPKADSFGLPLQPVTHCQWPLFRLH